jgi:general secretion pathway protein C
MAISDRGAARAPWPLRAVAALAALAAGAVLALVVAHWGWRWFGPAPLVVPRAEVPPPWSAVIAGAAPFGRASSAGGTAPAADLVPAAGTPSGDVRLLGVVAAPGGGGYALFRLGARGPALVKAGQALAPDVTLEAVLPDGVRIRDRGELRALHLRPPPTQAPAPSTPVVARGAAGPACAVPPGFKGGVYRVNAELLTGVGAQADGWRAVVAPQGGSLVVRDQSGFAAMLGMKPGDRLSQANGIALAAVEDVLAAVVKPLIASQSVRLAGTRDGKPAEWLLLNAGACPP